MSAIALAKAGSFFQLFLHAWEAKRTMGNCWDIPKSHTVTCAVPIVKAIHNAAIVSVDQKELETLMAHGLNSEHATEFIGSGMSQQDSLGDFF